MQHHLRLMHVHLHFGESIQHCAPKLHIQLHGIHGIIFSRSSGLHLKGKVLILIYLVHIVHKLLRQLLKAFVLPANHRTDGGNAKYGL